MTVMGIIDMYEKYRAVIDANPTEMSIVDRGRHRDKLTALHTLGLISEEQYYEYLHEHYWQYLLD